MKTLLQQAIDLAKSGQRKEAETILQQVLTQQPNNEVAWMWLSGVARDRAVKRKALETALSLNPNNALAKKGLVRFGGSPAESARSETPGASVSPMIGSPSEGAAPGEGPVEEETIGTEAPLPPVPQPPPPAEAPAGADFSDETPFPFTADSTAADSTEAIDKTEAPSPAPTTKDEGAFDFSEEFPFSFDEDFAAAAPTDPSTPPAEAAGEFDWGTFDFDAEMPPFATEESTPGETSPVDTLSPEDEASSEASSIDEVPAFDWSSNDPFDFEDAPETFSGLDTGSSEPAADVGAEEALPSFSDEILAPETEPETESVGTELPRDFASMFEGGDDASPEAEQVAESPDSDQAFDWDNPPAFDFDTDFNLSFDEEGEGEPFLNEDAPSEVINLADRLGGEPAILSNEIESEAGVVLDELEPELEEEDEELAVARATALAKRRQKRQQQILILSTILFSFFIVVAAVFAVFDDVVGRYTILPAPPALQKEASRPNNGVATMNFKGYPGAKARIEWTRDNDTETCSTPGTGLEVDFQTVDSFPISNQVCRGDSCAFEKELNQESITEVSISYQCGKDATITLFQSVE